MSVLPRVLVIDDDPLFRNLIASLLKQYYAVTTAESGSQGYRLAMDHPPHVALIDVQMPDWDGLETLKKFREHPDLCRTKTAMLTGDASRNTVVTAIRGGADEYIVKTNFSKEELLKKLKALIAKSSLPIVEEPPGHAKAPGVGESFRTSGTAAVSGNESDSRLQEMIDGWE